MEKDEQALDRIIEKALGKQGEVQVIEKQLAVQNEEFADYLRKKQRIDEELAVLWDMAKDFMEENHITKHENDYITLTLAPMGKYKAEDGVDIDTLPEEVCEITKSLSNKKVKAYLSLHGELPEGVVSMGNRLVKKLKDK